LNFCAENKNLGISELQKHIKSAFEKSKNLELEYAEFVSLNQMKEIKEWEAENQSAVCIAAYIYGVRLIDNIIL
jgi:pantoate--beta-alanine ligase